MQAKCKFTPCPWFTMFWYFVTAYVVLSLYCWFGTNMLYVLKCHIIFKALTLPVNLLTKRALFIAPPTHHTRFHAECRLL